MNLLCALVLKPAMDDLAGTFVAASATPVAVDYDSAGAIGDRIRAGEPCDVAVVQKHLLESLQGEGRIAPGSIVVLARSGVAVAVRAGAGKPDVETAEALKRALLAAKSVAYPDPARGHASGIHFAAVVERLGIGAAVAAKAVLMTGSLVDYADEGGDAELAITQPMEILATPGYTLAGLLPPELQDPEKFTWAAGIGAGARQPQAAEALIRFLASPAAASVIAAKGMTPVGR